MPSPKRTSQKKRKLLLAIIGMPGSGKGTAAKIAKKLGYTVVTFGDVVRGEARRRGLPLTSESMAKVADWFHKSHEPLMVRRLLSKIPKRASSAPFIVLDGPRSPGQVRLLKKHFVVKILVVTLPDRVRWKRQLARGRPDLGTIEDVHGRDRRELSYGLGTLIKKADWKISNNCTKQEFRRKMQKFLRKTAQSI